METAIFDADSHLMETPEWLVRLRRRSPFVSDWVRSAWRERGPGRPS